MPRIHSLASLKRSLEKTRQTSTKFSGNNQESLLDSGNVPMILLGYQQKWVSDQAKIKIVEKSRRIGISWAESCVSALEASKINGKSTFYIGYNAVMAKGFVQDVADWAKAYSLVASEVEEQVLQGEDEGVVAYSVRFASGFIVEALSSKPRSLRSKGKPNSRLVIDELAFHDSPEELVKAAIAFSMWGGTISIISTHNGKNSYFNQLIEESKNGIRPFSHHRYDIQDALNDGLFRRICLINNEEWSQAKEDQWLKDLVAEYGIGANEELYCIPSDLSQTKFIDRDWFKIIGPYEVPPIDIFCRGWDLASTEADVLTGKGLDSCRTVGTLIGFSSIENIYVVLDVVAVQFNPADTDRLLLEVARKDTDRILITSEQDPGSAGQRDIEHIKNLLSDYLYTPTKLTGSKLVRARDFASAAKNGRVWILRSDWNEDYLSELDNVPFGRMDCLDSSATSFNHIKDGGDIVSKMLAYFS